MESPASPFPPPSTVRRNPPRLARKTPVGKALVPAPPHSHDADAPVNSAPPDALKLYLRIRPLQISPPTTGRKPHKIDPGATGKGGLPNGEVRNNAACLTVNGPSSVTLSAPTSASDFKRVKNEVYDGFSFIFPPDSSQQDVYDRAINPVVMDFMGKKSSLLVAMGPTGSGKTYTMFGRAKEPGIVPLTLKQIFSCPSQDNISNLRSYYISMLEIYSERGKGEKIMDLSANGKELSFQNSTIVGLKEVKVSNIEEAENTLAIGLLKRSTASTSANNQSSRSQCIINIRSTEKGPIGNGSCHSTVLTIADLAGAEREKRTGNQGVRLQESSFINNTSMVFGLCLRSLLEHQRNPKKPLEKHFKNSLLTRYLRDYMEGKKRMALILTVKPGEDDYPDTSFLLRQASPYMNIKFANLEEHPNLPHKKRTTSSLVNHHKRRKVNISETPLDDEGSHRSDRSDGSKSSLKDADTTKLQGVTISESLVVSTEVLVPAMTNTARNDEYQMKLQILARREEIMGKFSKALWTVLKEYKQKLIESENNAQTLSEALRKEQIQVIELNKEIEKLKSHCCAEVHAPLGCSRRGLATPLHQVSSNSTLASKSTAVSPVSSPANEENPEVQFCHFVEDQLDKNSIGISQSMLPLVEETSLLEDKKISTSQASQSISVDQEIDCQNCQVDQMPQSMPETEVVHEESNGLADCEPRRTSTNINRSDNGNENPSSVISLSTVDTATASIVEEITLLNENRRISASQSVSVEQEFVGQNCQVIDQMLENITGTEVVIEKPKELADNGNKDTSSVISLSGLDTGTTSSIVEETAHLKENKRMPEIDVLPLQHAKSSEKFYERRALKEKNGVVDESSNLEKPKRRKLLPASAMLLKDLSTLDMETANQDTKGKLTGGGGHAMSQNNCSLLSLLRKQR